MADKDSRQTPANLKWTPLIVPFAASLLLALPYIYATTFYGLTGFDDEGTLMMTFRDLKEGSRLYDDSYALYGPFYYLSIGGLFTTLHLPLTHDMVRVVSAGFWAACTIIFAGLAFLLTRSRTVAIVAFVAALLDLRQFPHSPTHPEELCMLLLGCIPYLLYRIERGAAWKPAAAIGAIVVALMLAKINIGIFVGMALALVALGVSGSQAWLGAAFAVAAIAGVLLPPALMLPLFRFSWAVNYCVFAGLTILSAILVWWRTQKTLLFTPGHWLAALSAAAITAMAIIGIVLLDGTTPYAILNAVLLQNRHFILNWYLPTWFEVWDALAMVIGTASAIGYVWLSSRADSRKMARQAACWAKFALGVAGIVLICVSNIIQQGDPPSILFMIFEPFCWLLMIPPVTGRSGMPVTRAGIGLLAAFMVLYPFPVAGSQINDAVLLLTIMLPVLVHDAVTDLPVISLAVRRALGNMRYAGVLIFCLVAGTVLLIPTIDALKDYESGIPLGLPGTRLLRVDAYTAALGHWATQVLSKCEAFYTMPGQLSYYFWTGKPSPTKTNNNDTLGVLTDAQQEHVIAELSAYPHLCVLKVPSLQEWFDRDQVATHPPLLRYIDENFTLVAAEGPYRLLKRKPASLR